MHTNTSSQKNQHRNILAKKKKSFPQMHTNTSSQKNQHRDILAKNNNKKKRYTNTPTHRQTQTEKQKRDRSVLVIGAMDQCSCGSELQIGAAVDQCL